MDVEVHQIPVEREPDQAEACDGKRHIVELGPNPAAGLANATERIETNENGADGANDAENSEDYDPRRKPVDSIWIVGQGEQGHPANEENDKENTNEANNKTTLLVCRPVIQRFSIVFACNSRNRPEQNGQSHNAQTVEEYDLIEDLVLEQANFLKNKERIVKLELPVAVCIFFKSDMVLSVNLST